STGSPLRGAVLGGRGLGGGPGRGGVGVIVTEAGRLDVVVAALVPELSRSRARKLVEEGAVRVDGEVVTRPAQAVRAGADVEVVIPPPVPAEALPEDLPLRIVHEDADLVVLDKEPGMVVHP